MVHEHVSVRAGGQPCECGAQVYREFDIDGDGSVGADEMLALGKARRKW